MDKYSFPPPKNPIDIMFRVWCTSLPLSHMFVSLLFLDLGSHEDLSPETWSRLVTNGSCLKQISSNYLHEWGAQSSFWVGKVLCVMAIYLITFAPRAWFKSHNVWFWGWLKRDVICLEDFMPYLFIESVKGHEVLCRPPTPLEGHHVPGEQGILASMLLL